MRPLGLILAIFWLGTFLMAPTYTATGGKVAELYILAIVVLFLAALGVGAYEWWLHDAEQERKFNALQRIADKLDEK